MCGVLLKYFVIVVMFKEIMTGVGPLCKLQSDCVLLENCEPYMRLIKSSAKPLTAPVVNFFRSKECGFQEEMPRVCCSSVPTHIQDFKPARPESSRPFNVLSVEEDSTTIAPSTVHSTSRSTKVNRPTERTRPTKSFEEFREEFFSDIFDYSEISDMIFRRKRFDIDFYSDVEVR